MRPSEKARNGRFGRFRTAPRSRVRTVERRECDLSLTKQRQHGHRSNIGLGLGGEFPVDKDRCRLDSPVRD